MVSGDLFSRRLQGELTLADLKIFVERAILRLGGTFMPEGDLYRIETPSPLLAYRNVSARYDSACFRRYIAMPRKKAELMSVGHSLVDAIIAHLSHPSVAGDVSSIDSGDDQTSVTIRYIIDAHLEDGGRRVVYESAFIHQEGTWRIGSVREDLDLLQRNALANQPMPIVGFELSLQQRVEGAISDAIARFRSAHERVESAPGRVVGLSMRRPVAS
jgi:hypothetical protein